MMEVTNLKKGEEQVLYLYNDKEFSLTFNLKEDAKLIVFQYGINISGSIVINLNGSNATVEYHYSTINYNDNTFKITINHNAANTISNIYNHGINALDNSLVLDVTGYVPSTSSKCVVNQENQIINLNNGISTIKPNLLIDNYDITSSHAAYIGKFKDDLLFYLMSRGISKKKSIDLLIASLLINGGDKNHEVVKRMTEEIENI